ncbi:hypothetical protein PFISCL1PPCAC_21166, partial [Pristionchus fissidentatus]
AMTAGGSDERSDGTIDWKVNDILNWTTKESPVVEICGIPWMLKARTEKLDDEETLRLELYVNWISESNLWRCAAALIFSLVNIDPAKSLTERVKLQFDS